MYPGKHAVRLADQPAVIMAGSGETITYRELEQRSNRLAHLLRRAGLKPRDHYAIFMENTARYVECCSAGARSGLYYTCINSYLNADELAYIVNNSESRVLIISEAKRAVALAALAHCPAIELVIVVDGAGHGAQIVNLDEATTGLPDTPIGDERLGIAMLYSSGTTGRPKGVLKALPDMPPDGNLPLAAFVTEHWRYREGMIYLSPAPLYHAAPQTAVGLTIRIGGTAIIMERFDAEQFLGLVEKYGVTHSQLVPTMFSRMLKLPDEVRRRYDHSSLEAIVHAAAPCPIPVKEQMIDWWGSIIHEYYGATEGNGLSVCNSEEWLAHKGTVGRVVFGKLHILDDEMKPCPAGKAGTLWFETPTPFEYFNDPVKTAEARSADGTLTTIGDIGYLDGDELSLPHGSRHLHDHLGRGQHLPAGGGKPADHSRQGGGCGRVRGAQRRPWRGGQGGCAADAGRQWQRPDGAGAHPVLPRSSCAHQVPTLDRFRGGAAAAADGQALQAGAARPLLAGPRQPHRVRLRHHGVTY